MPRSYYFLIIILIPSLVYAQHHTSKTSINRQLFVGTVITNQESHTQWIQDIRTAFDQVLIRLSGNKNISSLPQMQQASLNIESYLLDYRYLRPKSGLRLEARFRTQSTLDLLRKSNQPIFASR